MKNNGNVGSVQPSRPPKASEKVAFEEVPQAPHKSHGRQSKRRVEYEREVDVLLLAEIILLRGFIVGTL